MYLTLLCRKVYSLTTRHSPCLSAPRQLAYCLLDVNRLLESAPADTDVMNSGRAAVAG